MNSLLAFVAEEIKPKLYDWKSANDAADDWSTHTVRLNLKHATSDCLTVSQRHSQMKLMLPIPEEPDTPAAIVGAATSAALAFFNYQVVRYKIEKEAFDKLVKIHKSAEEDAEKAFNDYSAIHAPNSIVLTGMRDIQTARKEAAVKITADLDSLGYSYEAAKVLIAANAPGDAALIAVLTPICNECDITIPLSKNLSILYECQDFVKRRFAPGQPSQHSFFKKKFEGLRDRDVSAGMHEVERLFISYLKYLQMSGGPIPESSIENALDSCLTHENWRPWAEDMKMETLRETPTALRKHTWQLVLRDISLTCQGEPHKDVFRTSLHKRTSTQAGFSSDQRGGGGKRGGQSWMQSQDARQERMEYELSLMPDQKKSVTFDDGHYGPGAAPGQAGIHCNRCWGVNHFFRDCQATKCLKCSASIPNGVYHNARICDQPHLGGGRSGGDGRGGRGARGGGAGRSGAPGRGRGGDRAGGAGRGGGGRRGGRGGRGN
jgi:hypothetical protein